MKARAAAGLALLALLVTLVLPRAGLAQAAAAEGVEAAGAGDDGDYRMSEHGRRFRVRFDPASRIWLGLGGALMGDARRPAMRGPEIGVGLGYRGIAESGVGPGRVVWQVDHRLLAGWVAPAARPMVGVPALDGVVYGASALRHDESPRIVLPLSPPVSVPFPFDVGVEGEVGRVWIPASPPAGAGEGAPPVPVIRVGVLRASALLDPWRSGVTGRSLEIGVGVRYDIDAYAEAAAGRPGEGAGQGAAQGESEVRALGEPRVVHRVAPMTAGSVRFRVQAEDGLTALDSRVDVIPHWTSEGVWRVMVLSAVHVERALIAINDQPVSAVLEGGYRLLPPALDAAELHDLRVGLGLSFAWQLR